MKDANNMKRAQEGQLGKPKSISLFRYRANRQPSDTSAGFAVVGHHRWGRWGGAVGVRQWFAKPSSMMRFMEVELVAESGVAVRSLVYESVTGVASCEEFYPEK